MKITLNEVETTALIPLSVRASETMRKNHRISDPMAVKIVEKLHIEPKKWDKFVTHECVVARTILFNEVCKKLTSNNLNTNRPRHHR
jgi:O-methyltransferase involved in polyketide biosynthesis